MTLRGESTLETIVSFDGQVEGAQGLLVTANGFTAENLSIFDTAGDGLKVEGGDGVRFLGVNVEWTGEPSEDNGAYGLYPVQCQNVLIEGASVRGASDAGIYVGQSEDIIVRNNRVEGNVAGIELENSFDADVHDNVATGNTGGILVFNLPGLQVQNGARIRVFDNDVFENNGPNFAPGGNIVAKIPPGTGFVALAAHQVEVFGNRFADNQTINAGIISYYITQLDFDDPDYDPYSDTIYMHDNVFEGGGTEPSGELGGALTIALTPLIDPLVIPDVVFDGILDPDKTTKDGFLEPEFNICLQDNGDADFANLDAENFFENANLDAVPHDCAHEPLAPVELPRTRS